MCWLPRYFKISYLKESFDHISHVVKDEVNNLCKMNHDTFKMHLILFSNPHYCYLSQNFNNDLAWLHPIHCILYQQRIFFPFFLVYHNNYYGISLWALHHLNKCTNYTSHTIDTLFVSIANKSFNVSVRTTFEYCKWDFF